MPSYLKFMLVPAIFMAGTTAVMSQGQSAADTVAARRSQFREIGTAFKSINDEMKKGTPSRFIMSSSARLIGGNLKTVSTMFPVGSGPAGGIKTKAKADIWANKATFDRLNVAAVNEANTLSTLLRGNNMAAIGVQVKKVGGTCKACHDRFRAED